MSPCLVIFGWSEWGSNSQSLGRQSSVVALSQIQSHKTNGCPQAVTGEHAMTIYMREQFRQQMLRFGFQYSCASTIV